MQTPGPAAIYVRTFPASPAGALPALLLVLPHKGCPGAQGAQTSCCRHVQARCERRGGHDRVHALEIAVGVEDRWYAGSHVLCVT